jgi:hypothetical protein
MQNLWLGMQEAGYAVYAELGFDTTWYELGTALREAVSNAHSQRRWKNKIKAFPACRTE